MAAPARANDWVELGSDSQQTRQSLELSGPTFEARWSYALGSGQIIATPVTSGGRVVIAGSNGALAALSARDGTLIWTQKLSGDVRSTPAVVDGRVVVPTMSGTLVALRTLDGTIAWQRPFGGQNLSSVQLVGASSPAARPTVVVGAGFPSQDVERIDALTGELVWQTPKGAIVALVYSTAAVAGDRLLIGMNGGRLQSLDLATGALGWKLDASGPVYLSSPLVVGDRAYFLPADQGVHLYGVDATSGAALPGFPVAIPDFTPVAGTEPFGQGPAVSSPMMAGGLVIVQVRRQDYTSSGPIPKVFMREAVVAIDPASAQVRWQHPLADLVAQNPNDVPELGLCATPAGFSSGDGAFVAVSSSLTGRLAVLDVATGQERWAAPLPAPGRSSPVFSNGNLFVATDDGRLSVFGSSSNHAPTAPGALSPAGSILFASGGTNVHWMAGSDQDGGPLSYIVRFEEDGAPETRLEQAVSPGQLSATIPLAAAKSYLVAVRTRDAEGALSPWSTPQRLQVGASDVGDPSTSPDMLPEPPAGSGPAQASGDAAVPDMPSYPPAVQIMMPAPSKAPVPPAAGPLTSMMDGSADARDGSADDARDASSAEVATDPSVASAAHATSAQSASDLDAQGCSVVGGAGAPGAFVLLLASLLLRRRRR